MNAPSVLFVCVKNGGKSQMAAALMRHRARGAIEVHSAGTKPGAALNEASRVSVATVGANFDGEFPKPIDPSILRAADRIIIVGGEAHVEPVEGMRGTIEKWEIDEPSLRGIEGEERMEVIRDDIDRRVRSLLAELTASTE